MFEEDDLCFEDSRVLPLPSMKSVGMSTGENLGLCSYLMPCAFSVTTAVLFKAESFSLERDSSSTYSGAYYNIK